jgi:hypothetical protein
MDILMFSSVTIATRLFSIISRKSESCRESQWGCACGEVQGIARVFTKNVPSAECHCGDCINFSRWMSVEKKSRRNVLNDTNGVSMIQLFHDEFHLTKGQDLITAVKLRPDSLLMRYYTSCCCTPVGLSPIIPCYPMVVLYRENFFSDIFGPVWWRVNLKDQIRQIQQSHPSSSIDSSGLSLSFVFFTFGRFVYGVLFGRGSSFPFPHPSSTTIPTLNIPPTN